MILMTNPLTIIFTVPAGRRTHNGQATTFTFSIYPPGFLGDDGRFFHTYVSSPRVGEMHLGGTHTRSAALALVDEHMLAIEKDIT